MSSGVAPALERLATSLRDGRQRVAAPVPQRGGTAMNGRKNRLHVLVQLAQLTGLAAALSGCLLIDPDEERMRERIGATQYVAGMDPEQLTLEVGQAVQIRALRAGGPETPDAVLFTEYDPQIISVRYDGQGIDAGGGRSGDFLATITGLAPGQTVIEASTSGNVGNDRPPGVMTVTVVPAQLDVTISPAAAELEPGQQTQLTCTVVVERTGEPVTGRTVRWSTSDPTVAVVADDGTVTAILDGTTQVTCSLDTGESASATVTVTGPQPPNISDIAGGFGLDASRTSDTCPTGSFPASIANPGPIEVVVIPSSGQILLQIRSTANVVGPYTLATGDYQGDGVVDLATSRLRESVSGRFEKTTGSEGVLIRLVAELAYEILGSGDQPVCRASYDALYTKLQ
jgi:hypothetical protein